MMEPVLDWEQRYQDAATAWERGTLNPAFDVWRDHLGIDSGTVIVPGCGRAPEVVEFAARGWNVIGVDLAATPVIFQREALAAAGLTGSVEQANLFDWNPPVPVDLVYEQTCLCALHPDQWSAYERALHRWLKPGGQLAAMFMQKEGEGGPPFHCGIDAMRNLFPEETWQWGEQLYRSAHQIGVCELAFLLTRR